MATLRTLLTKLLKSAKQGNLVKNDNSENEMRNVWDRHNLLDVISCTTEIYYRSKNINVLTLLSDVVIASPNKWVTDIYNDQHDYKKKIQTAFGEMFRVGRVPSFTKIEHHSFTSDDFTDVSRNCEAVLNVTYNLVEGLLKNNGELTHDNALSFLKLILPDLMILLMENLETNMWTSELTRTSASKIMKHILNSFSLSDVEQLLQLDLDSQTHSNNITTPKSRAVCKIFTLIGPNLTRENWKYYPGLKVVFSFCLFHTKFPHLSEYLEHVLPPTLLFVDDFVTENKVLGIRCMHHVISNVSGEELRWYGRAEVIFEALKHQLYTHEVPVVEVSHPAMLTILNIVEKSPEKFLPQNNTRHLNRYDEIFQMILQDAEFETNLALRRAYTCNLDKFVDRMGLTVIRHSKRVIRVITNYLEVYDGPSETSRLNILKFLEIFIKVAWPRMECHSPVLVKSLFKLLYDIHIDNTMTPEKIKTELIEKSKVCLVLLKSCIGYDFDKSVSPLVKSDLPKAFRETLNEILSSEINK